MDEEEDIPKALVLWKKAITVRMDSMINKINKTNIDPNPSYLNKTEAQTMEDLEKLEDEGPDAVYMESLMIRERIRGTKDVDVIYFIHHRGAATCTIENILKEWIFVDIHTNSHVKRIHHYIHSA